MSQTERALYYIFILSLVLIAVAYYAGSSQILSSFGKAFGDLLSIATGRNPATGQFAGYPSGTPTGSVH